MKVIFKKTIVNTMLLLFICQLFFTGKGYTASAVDFDTNLSISYTVSKTTVNKGESFVVNLTIKNTSGYDMSNIYINLDPAKSSFYAQNGDNTIKADAALLKDTQSTTKTITLVYGGGLDKNLDFTIHYSIDNGGLITKTVEKVIHINAIDPSEIPASNPVDTKKMAPKLAILATTVQTVNAGEVVTITFPIKNSGAFNAMDVTVTPFIEKDDNLIFVDDFNASKNIVQILPNSTENVTFRFRTSSNAPTKSYPIKLSMDYNNPFGDSYSTQSTVYLKVAAAPSTVSELELTNITSMPDTIAAGEKTTMTIGVKNTGTAVLKEIKVSLSGIKEDVLSLGTGASRKIITELLPGREANVTFSLAAAKKASEGSFPINVKVEGKDTNDKVLTDEQSYYIEITNKDNSGLDITSINALPKSVEAGKNTYVEITAKNNGNYALSNIKFMLSGFKEDTLTIVDGSNKKTAKALAPNEECKIVFTIAANKNAIEGSYALNAKVECKDKADKLIGDEQSIYIGVTKNDTVDSNIEIQDLSIPNTALVSNKEFSLGFKLANTGTDSIKNIKVTLTPDPLLIAKTPTAKAVSKLGAKNKLPMKFLFMIPRDAADKNYPIQIAVEYDVISNGQKTKQTVNQYTNVYVDNFGVSGNKKSVPKIIISKYSIEPAIPKAGSNIKLQVSFLNTNSFKTVRNIKIYLAADGSQTESGNVFVPVNSSNTFYIDSINPKQIINKQLELYIVNDAKPKTYNLTANFEYEDETGTEYKAVETIGIPVRPQAKLETSSIMLPPEVSIIDPIIVSFDMYNTGKSLLRNLMIKSIGNFDVQNQNSFIGNLDVGNQEHYEATLVAKGAGDLKGYIQITFEDAGGQLQEIRKEIATKVTNPPPMPSDGQNVPTVPVEGNSGKLDKKIIFGAAGAGVVIIAAAIIIIKKRKRRKLEEMMLGE